MLKLKIPAIGIPTELKAIVALLVFLDENGRKIKIIGLNPDPNLPVGSYWTTGNKVFSQNEFPEGDWVVGTPTSQPFNTIDGDMVVVKAYQLTKKK